MVSYHVSYLYHLACLYKSTFSWLLFSHKFSYNCIELLIFEDYLYHQFAKNFIENL